MLEDVGVWVVGLNRMVKENLTLKMTFVTDLKEVRN